MGKNWKYTKLFYTLFILLIESQHGKARLSGFIGCKTDEALCLENEYCYDDELFGNCQSLTEEPEDDYTYNLDTDTLEVIETELERLNLDGYSWQNVYTQCIMGNILYSYRYDEPWDPLLCETDDEKDMILDEEPLDNIIDSLRDKKDEFVKIHKYFKDDDKRGKNYLLEEELQIDPSLDESLLDTLISQLSTKDVVLLIQAMGDGMKKNKLKRFDEPLLFQQQQQNSPWPVNSDEPDIENYEINEAPANMDENNIWQLIEGMDEPDEQDAVDQGSDEDEKLLISDPEEAVLSDTIPTLPPGVDTAILANDKEIIPDKNELINDYPLEIDDTKETADYPGTSEYEDNDAEYASSNEPMITPNEAAMLSAIMRAEEEAKSAPNNENEDISNDFIDYNELPEKEMYQFNDYVQPEDPLFQVYEDYKDSKDQNQPEETGQNQPEETVLKDEIIKKTEGKKKAVKKEQMDDEIGENAVGNARIKVISTKADAKRVHMSPKKNQLKSENSDDKPEHHTKGPKFKAVDGNYAFVQVNPNNINYTTAVSFVNTLEKIIGLPAESLVFETVHDGEITFYINQLNLKTDNATAIASQAMTHANDIKNVTGYTITNAGMGRETKVSLVGGNGPKYFVLTFVLCGCVAGILIAVVTLYIVKSHSRIKEKLKGMSKDVEEQAKSSKDYEDLCRQHMLSKSNEKQEVHNTPTRVNSVNTAEVPPPGSPTNRSSTSSWSEEPVQTNMDISTGHIVLSYMEDHLKNKDRLDEEWDALCAYEAEPSSTDVASEPANMRKNRYSDALPYDHSRVVLSNNSNVSNSDYINANTITDHDPRNPAYVATQGPLPHTVADFWQMIWEQGSVVIVQLTKLTENGAVMCHRYWPEEGSDLYHIYEVHLVSEHIWCDDYLVRSFYLKNLQTNETRTVTQFHFLTWSENDVPSSSKALLDFRRKVNKSYRRMSCPIVVHCSDGIGRTGTYCLIDMVLNRLSKGAKEIDIAATLEHIRDQRMNGVKTKEQFEFALAAVAEEVHAVLKALPQ